MKTALVTGASGMLGTHIVERLATDGWCVRALMRDRSSAPWLDGLAVSHKGDLHDAPSLMRAARGCDAVFHAGAVIGSGGAWETFRALNVAGTANVVEAAAAAGARLVHVSSTAVYGSDRYQSQATDEQLPLPQLPARDVYGRSKQEAERVVLEAQRAGRLWATVVRPPLMYGRRDRQFVPRIAPALLRGVFPLIAGGHTKLPLVSASAVADGAVRAAAFDGAAGRVYLLANDTPVTVADLARFAAEGLARRVRTPSVTVATGGLAFLALEAALCVVGRRDLAAHARGTFRMLTHDNPFTSQRAQQELGWAPQTDPSRVLPQAFQWWMSSRGATSQIERRD